MTLHEALRDIIIILFFLSIRFSCFTKGLDLSYLGIILPFFTSFNFIYLFL